MLLSCKVLFIDDSEDIRDIYTTLLQDEGISVIAAKDGQEGLRQFESKNPQMILTDIVMPKLGGIEMIQLIRKKNKDIPIIAISGDPSQALKSSQAGANKFLAKPFCSKILLMNIKQHI